MEPVRIQKVVCDQAFLHQIKWDGIRGVAEIQDGAVNIWTKNGVPCGSSYPELSALPKSIKADHAVLDGEMVVFDNGHPSFYHVLRRHRTKSAGAVRRIADQYPVRYIVFDLLFLSGEDVRPRPLEERQKMLAEIFVDTPVAAKADSFDDGAALYTLMKQQNMEGIVSKRRQSPYIGGKKHSDWYKTKIEKKLLCAVTGIREEYGVPKSLVLGIFHGAEMVDIGHVSAGLKQSDLAAILSASQPLCKQKDMVRLHPQLTCWVRFGEWTQGGTLRHPVLIGFSDQDVSRATGEEISV